MKSLNDCIDFTDNLQKMELKPTHYCELYPVTETDSLLLNLLTGAIDLVDKDEIRFIEEMLESKKVVDMPNYLRTMLIKRGYISDADIEQEIINDLASCHQKQIYEKPIDFFICTTFTCPVGCSYCFEGKLAQNIENIVLNEQQIDSIFLSIDEIIKKYNRPLKEIVLFGGEPLLPITIPSVRKILHCASVRKFKISICTSGVFSSKFVSLFREFSDTVSLVRVTIDGPKEHHNALRKLPKAFESAVEGIDALLKANIPVMTRTNVNNQNIEFIPKMATYFIERGWTDYQHFDAIITAVKDRGCTGDKNTLLREDELAIRFLKMRADFEAVKLLRPVNIFMSLKHLASNLGHLEGIIGLQSATNPSQTIKFHGCGSIDESMFIFGTDNKIYSCTEAIGKPQMSIGGYHPKLILDSDKTKKWHKWHKYKIPECRKCKYLLVCGGTCTMTSVIQFGSGEKPVCPPISQIMEGYVKALSSQIVLK